jgi:hypothetical protein
MADSIQQGFMVFTSEGREGIGAVLSTTPEALQVYIENSGPFDVPRSAVSGVHDGKVMVNVDKLPAALLRALGHAHDAEDPNLTG